MASAEIRGTAPTAEDVFWRDAAAKMTPDKSIERLDSHGKFLFSTVSVVGTVLTGFGLLTSAVGQRTHWWVIPVLLACISLALAMTGLTPRPDTVNRADLNSVRDHYNSLLKRRGWAISWAGRSFALAILAAGVVMIAPLEAPLIAPAITVRLIGTGEKTTVTGKVEVQGLPESGSVETEITGVKETARGAEVSVLFKEITRADKAGKVSVSAEIDQVGSYNLFVVHATVKDKSRTLQESRAEVRR